MSPNPLNAYLPQPTERLPDLALLSRSGLFGWWCVAKVVLHPVRWVGYVVVVPRRGGSVYVATIRTKGRGDRVYTSHLLRRSYREDGKVEHENLGNLSHLPPEAISAVKATLAGKALVDLDEAFSIERSLPHGHVAAVLGVLRGLDLERLIGRERCREHDLIVAMIVQRLIGPGSKLSATRRFGQTTLADELDLGEVTEAELLGAMDWLLGRQQRIERTLARRHLAGEGSRWPSGPSAR